MTQERDAPLASGADAVPHSHTEHFGEPEKGYSRRALISAGGLAIAGAGAAALAGPHAGIASDEPASPRTQVRLKLVTTWPKNFPGLGTGVERFADRVAQMSSGAIQIRVYAAGELVPALGAFDAVSEGKADMYHGAEYYWQGKHPAFSFFTSVPFGLVTAEMNAWIYHGGGQALWDELAAPFNIKAMPCGNTGVQAGGWFKKPIRSLADFRGMRIRMPGLGGEVCQQLGATPVTKAGGEIFLALSQGNIDATEWIGPWNDLAFGFYSVAPHYYGPGFHEPGAMLSLGVNLKVWNDLPPSYQAMIREAAAAENDRMFAEFQLENARALQTLEREHGVVMQPFPDDLMRAARQAAEAVLARVGAHDEIARRVYQGFMAMRALNSRWTLGSETAYASARATTANAG